MEPVSITDFCRAVGGPLENIPHFPPQIGSISTDSRTLKPGDVFWALRGEHYDGHHFVNDALEKGAALCLVDQNIKNNSNETKQRLISVPNTLTALQQFARWYRLQYSPTTIGITGSYGKTTTRELLHRVLGVKYPGVQSLNNYNNEFGVPLTIFNLEWEHKYLIVEMGAAKPGDILPLAQIAAPHIGVITGIGPAHLAGFQTTEQIVKTKGDLIASLPKHGLAVIPGDNEWTKPLYDRAACRVLTFGLTAESSVYATDIRTTNKSLNFQVNRYRYHLPTTGKHHIFAALSAITIARELGYTPEEIQEGLHQFQPVPGRGDIRQTDPWTVIDDTYNANPTSCRAACEMLADWDSAGKRILVLGDMLELGPNSSSYHEQLGRFAAEKQIDVILALGEQAEFIITGATKTQKTRAQAFHDDYDLLKELQEILKPNDVVLVKGSRGMRMERIVEALAEQNIHTIMNAA